MKDGLYVVQLYDPIRYVTEDGGTTDTIANANVFVSRRDAVELTSRQGHGRRKIVEL